MRACAIIFFIIIIFYDSHDLELGEIDLGSTGHLNSAEIHVDAY